MRILTPEEPYYEVYHSRGKWYNRSAPYYSREDAQSLALLLMTEIHSREKDSPDQVEIMENKKVIRRWTKLDVDTWKEWAIND